MGIDAEGVVQPTYPNLQGDYDALAPNQRYGYVTR